MNPSEIVEDLLSYSFDQICPGDAFITCTNDFLLIIDVFRDTHAETKRRRITVQFLLEGMLLTKSALGGFLLWKRAYKFDEWEWPVFAKGIRISRIQGSSS